jgi:hypothetical protein
MTYAPRAIRHFGLANLEARAQRTARVMTQRATPVRSSPEPRGPRRRVVIRLWLPLTLLFLLLAPFAFLLAPCIYCFTPPAYRTRPFAAVLGLGQVLLSLGGTVVDVDAPGARVSLRIF